MVVFTRSQATLRNLLPSTRFSASSLTSHSFQSARSSHSLSSQSGDDINESNCESGNLYNNFQFLHFNNGEEIQLKGVFYKNQIWYKLSEVKQLLGFSKNYKSLGVKLATDQIIKGFVINSKYIKNNIDYINMSGLLRLIIMQKSSRINDLTAWILNIAAVNVEKSLPTFEKHFNNFLKCDKVKSGIIYAVQSPLFPWKVKVGKTINLKKRLNTLNTSIPTVKGNYIILRAFESQNIDKLEKFVHSSLKKSFAAEKEHYHCDNVNKFLKTFDRLTSKCRWNK